MQQTIVQPNPETVWAILREVAAQQKDNAEQLREVAAQQKDNAEQLKELDRIVKENAQMQKETERILKENVRENDRLIKDNAERQKETERILKEGAERQKETERILKENVRENDRILKENAKENDRLIKDNARKLGKLDARFGEFIEYLVAPNLQNKFRELGLDFPRVGPNYSIKDHKNNVFLEIDFILEDGSKVMLVEVKVKPTIPDVKEHIKRLHKMRAYSDLRGDTRTFLGSIAGAVVPKHVKAYVLEQGLYVLEPSGETFTITPPNGQPKEW